MPAPPDLIRRTPEYVLPLTRSGGLPLTIHARDPETGARVPWPPGTVGHVELAPKIGPLASWDGALTAGGALTWAVLPVDTDQAADGDRWRAVVTVPGGVPRVVLRGPIKRCD